MLIRQVHLSLSRLCNKQVKTDDMTNIDSAKQEIRRCGKAHAGAAKQVIYYTLTDNRVALPHGNLSQP